MKWKHYFALLGIRPRTRTYGHEVRRHTLARDGEIEFAHWLHPRDWAKEFRQEQVDVLRQFLAPGDVAIDIGAHTGDTTLPIALATGAQGLVFALEPNPFVYAVLEANAGLNRSKTRIVPLAFAATPDDGQFFFEYSDSGFCNGGLHHGISKWKHGHPYKLEVSGKNLERYLRAHYPEELSRVRYVKIDAEGFDFEVLKSIRGIVESCRPYLKIEMYKYAPEETRRSLVLFLRERGYDVHKTDSEYHYLGEKITEADVARWSHYDIFAVPRKAAAVAAG